MKFEYPPGATPLDINEIDGLKIGLSTQGQLNEFEAQNIADAEQWLRGNSGFRAKLISVGGLLELHRRMFDDVWKWAGTLRRTEKNIGVSPSRIAESVGALCGDVGHWTKNSTFEWNELAVRFHHRLTVIHPFSNGNGRHARLAANLLLEFNGRSRLPWGRNDLVQSGETRAEYIAALKKADQGSFAALFDFSLSRG